MTRALCASNQPEAAASPAGELCSVLDLTAPQSSSDPPALPCAQANTLGQLQALLGLLFGADVLQCCSAPPAGVTRALCAGGQPEAAASPAGERCSVLEGGITPLCSDPPAGVTRALCAGRQPEAAASPAGALCARPPRDCGPLGDAPAGHAFPASTCLCGRQLQQVRAFIPASKQASKHARTQASQQASKQASKQQASKQAVGHCSAEPSIAGSVHPASH